MALSKNKCGSTVNPDMADKKLRYVVGNLQGVGARERQEDAFTLMNALSEEQYDNLGLMFAVFDGMGGMKDGKLASDTAVASMRTFFSNMDRQQLIPPQLEEAVSSASKAVENVLGGDGGSTAVVGIIHHERLFFASVGDSFLYLYRNGGLYRLNTEHTICTKLYLDNIRKGSTETQSCRTDVEAKALSKFLGMPWLDEFDVSARPFILHKEDVLLACSDGVGGVVSEDELREALAWPEPQAMCQKIEEYIVKRAKPNQDNYTALILKCK